MPGTLHEGSDESVVLRLLQRISRALFQQNNVSAHAALTINKFFTVYDTFRVVALQLVLLHLFIENKYYYYIYISIYTFVNMSYSIKCGFGSIYSHHRWILWFPSSPNMSPIEHIWDYISRRLAHTASRAQNATELWLQIGAIWNAIL